MDKVLVLDDCELVKSLGYAAKSDIELVPFCEEIHDIERLAEQVKSKIELDTIVIMIDLNFGGIHKGLELIRELRIARMGLPIIFTVFENETSLYPDPNSIILKSDNIVQISKSINISEFISVLNICKIRGNLTDDSLDHIYEQYCTEHGITSYLLDDLSYHIQNFQKLLQSHIIEVENLIYKPSIYTIPDLYTPIADIKRSFLRLEEYTKPKYALSQSNEFASLGIRVNLFPGFNASDELTLKEQKNNPSYDKDKLTIYLKTLKDCKARLDITKNAMNRLNEGISDKLAMEKMRSISHKYKAQNAAMRILHGAYLASELTLEKYKSALDSLKLLGINENDLNLFYEIAKEINRKASEGKSVTDTSEVFVFIDDEYDKSGWDVVLNTLLNNEGFRIKSFNDYYDNSEAKCFVKETWDKNKLAGILLDIKWKLDNGEEIDKGLDILPMIKKDFYDVPVIMLTAADEAHATKKAIQLGASDYFVKELKSDTDRDYIEYYKSFKETINSITTNEIVRSNREIWRKIKKFKGKIDDDIRNSLHRAYFYLTVNNEAPDVKYILLPTETNKKIKSTYIESIEKSGSVIEKIVNSDWKLYFREDRNSDIWTMRKSIEKLKKTHWSDIKMTEDDIFSIYKARSKATHNEEGDHDLARRRLNKVLNFMDDWLKNRSRTSSAVKKP